MIGDRQSLPTAKNFVVTGGVLQESRQLVSSGDSIGGRGSLPHSVATHWGSNVAPTLRFPRLGFRPQFCHLLFHHPEQVLCGLAFLRAKQ